MRILLQHTGTRLYLRSLDTWTPNSYEALDFQHSQSAINFARALSLCRVQIVVKFIDGHCDEIVPLPFPALAPEQLITP
jgi:hypothetical protein